MSAKDPKRNEISVPYVYTFGQVEQSIPAESSQSHENPGEVVERIGNIFDAPQDSVLIHACNCQGEWGSGIAAAMRDRFPEAYRLHRAFCKAQVVADTPVIGTTQLIPPQKEDATKSGRYWIACLFTSLRYGRRKDKPFRIAINTRDAFADLKKKLQDVSAGTNGIELIGKLYTVRINAKAFNVPWASTRRAIQLSGMKIIVINNVAIMGDKERDEVLSSMGRYGQDLEKVQQVRTGLAELHNVMQKPLAIVPANGRKRLRDGGSVDPTFADDGKHALVKRSKLGGDNQDEHENQAATTKDQSVETAIQGINA